MLGIGNNEPFGIDENAFKSRDEQRLAENARNRQQQVELDVHMQALSQKEEVVDASVETKALQSVGSGRTLQAPRANAPAPSGEASGLKGQELRA